MSKTRSRIAITIHQRMAVVQRDFLAPRRPDKVKRGTRTNEKSAKQTVMAPPPSRLWRDSWPSELAPKDVDGETDVDYGDAEVNLVDIDDEWHFGFGDHVTVISSNRAASLEPDYAYGSDRIDAESRTHSRNKESLKQRRRDAVAFAA